MAEPVNTIGASAPTEPPNPMVMAEAITDVQQLCRFSRERFDEMAYKMRVIPCDILSLTTYRTNSEVKKMPITGKPRYHQLYELLLKCDVSNTCISLMIKCRTKAATEAKKPMAKARIIVICRSVICFSRHINNLFSNCCCHSFPSVLFGVSMIVVACPIL